MTCISARRTWCSTTRTCCNAGLWAYILKSNPVLVRSLIDSLRVVNIEFEPGRVDAELVYEDSQPDILQFLTKTVIYECLLRTNFGRGSPRPNRFHILRNCQKILHQHSFSSFHNNEFLQFGMSLNSDVKTKDLNGKTSQMEALNTIVPLFKLSRYW